MKVSRVFIGIALAGMALALLFSVSACSTETEEEIPEVVETEEVTESESVAPQLNDAQIASIAVVANQVDVNYGKLALEKSKDAEVRKFAQTMIDDHKTIINTAVELATRLGVIPDDENDITQSLLDGERETVAKLNSLNGEDFNRAYIENEVTYHETVINAIRDVLIPQTENSELKETLEGVLPLLDHHLEMAKMAKDKISK